MSNFELTQPETAANQQRVIELKSEAVRCRNLARKIIQKAAEKERESRQMHGKAIRVSNHADKLKKIRASNLQKIEQKVSCVSVIIVHFLILLFFSASSH